MIVVAFIVIVAFAWFFNPYDTRSGNLNQALAFRIGKEGVTVKEVQRQQRICEAGSDLGFNFIMQLLQPRFDLVEFTQNRILLHREARKLGIDPSEAEVEEAIAAHPSFQRNGSFSEDAYLDTIENTLKPAGLVAGDLRELVADKIRLEKMTTLLSSGADVPESLVDIEFQRERELVTASVVDFKLEDFEKDVEVTDSDLQAFYDELKASYPSKERLAEREPLSEDEQAANDLLTNPEKRKIEFVFFKAPDAPLPTPTTPTPAPTLTPPPLLQPNAGGSASSSPLTAPPIELNLNPDAEAEPPGQAPEDAAGDALDAAAQLPDELPPAPDGDPTDLGNLDLNVGGLTEDNAGLDAPKLDLDLGDLDLPDLQTAPAAGAAPGGDDEYEAKMDEHAQQVDAFYTKLYDDPAQLAPLAEAEGLEVKTTELFTLDEPPTDPNVPAKLAQEVFNATMETDEGLIVPVEGLSPKGFYVARLLEIEEASQYAFEEAKEALREALIERKAKEKLDEAAKEARKQLVAALEAGKSFADAASEQDLTVREIPEFSVNKRPVGAEAVNEIMQAVPKTTTGSVSEVTPAGDNALLVYVSQRVAASEEAPEQPADAPPGGAPNPVDEKKNLADRLARQIDSGVFQQWMADRRQVENLDNDTNRIDPMVYIPRNLFGGGGGGFGF